MAAIVFPISSAPGSHGQEGAGQLINCRAVKTEQGAHAPFKWPRTAGLREKLTLTLNTHCRGLILISSTLIHVLDNRVYAVSLSGSSLISSDLGVLSGTDNVTIARNNASPPNVVAVCDAGTFNLFPAAAPSAFADGDLPAVNSCESANGYLVFSTASGEIWATDLNAVTVSSSSFVESELPNGLLRVIWYRDELFAFGPSGIKVYDETGATPFPFQYKKIHIPVGIIGTHAVAGNQDGFTGQLGWVASDYTVRLLDGYTPKIISNEDVSRAIATAANPALIQMSAYMDGQYPILSITSPDEWTWEVNLLTLTWNERKSDGRSDWRARCTVKAFDMWLAGDDTTGKLGKIDPTYRLEFGSSLVWEIVSGSNAAFPKPIVIGPATFWFNAALGDDAGADVTVTDPSVLISWSLNGGYSYGSSVTRALGAEGVARRSVEISTVGLANNKGVRFHLQVSDPVEPGFQGGEMPNVKARAA
jgi:hypothetical protein